MEQCFHITCVMYKSRSSERMLAYKIKNDFPEYLELFEEEKLVEIICLHIQKFK